MKKVLKKIASSIGSFLKRVTQPIRSTSVWKWLRKHILKSPFKGYFVSSFKELKKVTWPDRKTSVKLTLIVIAFSFAFAMFTAALDVGFERLAKELFLN